MKRRDTVLGFLALGATGAPLVQAQPANKVWRIGFLAVRAVPPSPSPDPLYMAFFRDLQELGYVEGKNLEITWRSSDGRNERLPQLAADLAQMKLDLIVVITDAKLSQ